LLEFDFEGKDFETW